MPTSVIACDLGTGSTKAALWRDDGRCMAECVVPYPTFYPHSGFHEQRPGDWWASVAEAIRRLLAEAGPAATAEIQAIALSGHSLGCLPLDAAGEPLLDAVPIWSDGRATEEAAAFFRRHDFGRWYHTTGNGFPAELYPLFKLMWMRAHEPAAMARAHTIVGTKDYVNFRLSGVLATDPSYASGSGAYDLRRGDYADDILDSAGLDRALLPRIVASTSVLGDVRPEVARQLGLPPGVRVVAGGVDNSCMALGANTFRDGDVYCSMGSSSWLTVASAEPVTDDSVVPFVFAHVVPGSFISATSIFSSGTSLKWVGDLLSGNAPALDAEAMITGALASPRGARGLLFVPTLGGGTSFEGGPRVRGALLGLSLQHDRADVLRAVLEGIALALGVALVELRRITFVKEQMLIVGGGSRSAAWRQILADLYGCEIVKTGIDQQAASLGAAALALVGLGAWADFSPIGALHVVEDRLGPEPDSATMREAMLAAYRQAAEQQRALAAPLETLRQLSSAAAGG